MKCLSFNVVRVLAALACLSLSGHALEGRASEADEGGIAVLLELLAGSDDPQFHLDILKGMNDAMEGRRQVAPPRAWAAVRDKLLASTNRDVRMQARSLALTFGDTPVFALMRTTVADRAADPAERRHALGSVLASGDKKLPGLLHRLLDDQAMREPALTALAAYDDSATPGLIIAAYGSFDAPARLAALNTLAARPDYARKLLSAVRDGRVPSKDLSAATARLLRDLDDPDIDAFVDQTWGVARTTPREKLDLINRYKALLTEQRINQADASRGRAVFARSCAQCHRLYNEGGLVGPDLTGSNRFNLDYVLQNIIDPSAVIAREFQVTLIRTKDGRVISGIATEGEHAIRVVSESGTVIVPRQEIDRLKRSELSMMPDGLINGLSETDVADLVAYLRTTDQVPLLEGATRDLGLKKDDGQMK